MPQAGHSCRGEISVAFYKGLCYNTLQTRQKRCRVRTSVVQRLPKPLRRVRLPYPAPKETVIRKDDRFFWVPPPKGGFTLRRLQCSGQVNCPCAKGLPGANHLYGANAPRPGRAGLENQDKSCRSFCCSSFPNHNRLRWVVIRFWVQTWKLRRRYGFGFRRQRAASPSGDCNARGK